MYSGKPHSELNDDQKKTLATLPSLEAVRKELEEVRKAVEVSIVVDHQPYCLLTYWLRHLNLNKRGIQRLHGLQLKKLRAKESLKL